MLLWKLRAIVAAAGAAVGISAGWAYGQTPTHWLNPVGDVWSNAAAWDNGAPVNPTFDAFVTVPGTYTVSLDNDFSVHSVTLGTASPSGITLALTTHTLSLTGDYTQDGTGNILLGTITAGSMTIAGTTTLGDATLMHIPNFTANGPMVFNGSNVCEICDTGVGHSGNCQWTGAGNILMDEGATFTNGTGSTFSDQGAGAHMIFWDNTGTRPTFTNAGTFTKASGAGMTSITGVTLNNTGMVRVDSGTLSADTVAQVSAGTLSGGHWMVTGGSTLDLNSALTTNAGDVTLQGAGSTFASISGLTTNAAAGSLTLSNGNTFSTTGAFSNNGTVTANAGTFTSTGQLTNTGTLAASGATGLINAPLGLSAASYSGTTLTGGTYNASGGATMHLNGVDVHTLNASVTLSGAGSDIVSVGTTSSLTDLSVIGSSGAFSIQNGRNFQSSQAAGDFTVAPTGILTVGAGTMFQVGGQGGVFHFMTNFSGGVSNAGTFRIAGTLQFRDASITTVNNSLDLDGPGNHIIDQNGNSAFATLNRVQNQGNLNVLNGHQLTLTQAAVPTFTLSGRLGIAGSGLRAPSMVDVEGDFAQDAGGILDLDGGILTVGGSLTLNGSVTGSGTINNANAQLNGRMSPGQSGPGLITVNGGMSISTTGIVETKLGGGDPGLFDQIFVQPGMAGGAGAVTFSSGLAGLLRVSLINGFEPTVGQVFDVLHYTSRAGQFAGYVGLDLGNGRSLEVHYLADRLELVVVPSPASALLLVPLLAARRRRRSA